MHSPKVDTDSPAFELLSDLIAEDYLVVISGAGVSRGLERKDGKGKIPGWKELLAEIFGGLRAKLVREEAEEIEAVLSEADPSAQSLIEIASILREADEGEYVRELLAQVTPKSGACSPTHLAIEELCPRGIVTFNYDDCHENAFERKNREAPRVLTPYSEEAMVESHQDRMRSRFVLKAHGCVRDTRPRLVLDWQSYRSLLAKQPAYRAFLQNVLTSFDCLFVGFGLSDPDFDTFVDVIAATYGSPVRQHIAIRRANNDASLEFVWRRRYGIQCLHVSDYSRIPSIIAEAARRAGPHLSSRLDDAVSDDFATRQSAHNYFRALGPLGKRSASEALKSRITTERDEFRLSEIVYSLGVIDPRSNRQELIEAVANPSHRTAQPASRALTVLRPVLDHDDLEMIRDWVLFYKSNRYPDDSQGRLEKYCDYLLVYVLAKHGTR